LLHSLQAEWGETLHHVFFCQIEAEVVLAEVFDKIELDETILILGLQ